MMDQKDQIMEEKQNGTEKIQGVSDETIISQFTSSCGIKQFLPKVRLTRILHPDSTIGDFIEAERLKSFKAVTKTDTNFPTLALPTQVDVINSATSNNGLEKPEEVIHDVQNGYVLTEQVQQSIGEKVKRKRDCTEQDDHKKRHCKGVCHNLGHIKSLTYKFSKLRQKTVFQSLGNGLVSVCPFSEKPRRKRGRPPKNHKLMLPVAVKSSSITSNAAKLQGQNHCSPSINTPAGTISEWCNEIKKGENLKEEPAKCYENGNDEHLTFNETTTHVTSKCSSDEQLETQDHGKTGHLSMCTKSENDVRAGNVGNKPMKSEKPRKKRGRKPKYFIQQSLSICTKSENDSKAQNVGNVPMKSEKPRKKRGRKPKYFIKQSPSEAPADSTTVIISTAQSKKRGRKPKNKVENTAFEKEHLHIKTAVLKSSGKKDKKRKRKLTKSLVKDGAKIFSKNVAENHEVSADCVDSSMQSEDVSNYKSNAVIDNSLSQYDMNDSTSYKAGLAEIVESQNWVKANGVSEPNGLDNCDHGWQSKRDMTDDHNNEITCLTPPRSNECNLSTADDCITNEPNENACSGSPKPECSNASIASSVSDCYGADSLAGGSTSLNKCYNDTSNAAFHLETSESNCSNVTVIKDRSNDATLCNNKEKVTLEHNEGCFATNGTAEEMEKSHQIPEKCSNETESSSAFETSDINHNTGEQMNTGMAQDKSERKSLVTWQSLELSGSQDSLARIKIVKTLLKAGTTNSASKPSNRERENIFQALSFSIPVRPLEDHPGVASSSGTQNCSLECDITLNKHSTEKKDTLSGKRTCDHSHNLGSELPLLEAISPIGRNPHHGSPHSGDSDGSCHMDIPTLVKEEPHDEFDTVSNLKVDICNENVDSKQTSGQEGCLDTAMSPEKCPVSEGLIETMAMSECSITLQQNADTVNEGLTGVVSISSCPTTEPDAETGVNFSSQEVHDETNSRRGITQFSCSEEEIINDESNVVEIKGVQATSAQNSCNALDQNEPINDKEIRLGEIREKEILPAESEIIFDSIDQTETVKSSLNDRNSCSLGDVVQQEHRIQTFETETDDNHQNVKVIEENEKGKELEIQEHSNQTHNTDEVNKGDISWSEGTELENNTVGYKCNTLFTVREANASTVNDTKVSSIVPERQISSPELDTLQKDDMTLGDTAFSIADSVPKKMEISLETESRKILSQISEAPVTQTEDDVVSVASSICSEHSTLPYPLNEEDDFMKSFTESEIYCQDNISTSGPSLLSQETVVIMSVDSHCPVKVTEMMETGDSADITASSCRQMSPQLDLNIGENCNECAYPNQSETPDKMTGLTQNGTKCEQKDIRFSQEHTELDPMSILSDECIREECKQHIESDKSVELKSNNTETFKPVMSVDEHCVPDTESSKSSNAEECTVPPKPSKLNDAVSTLPESENISLDYSKDNVCDVDHDMVTSIQISDSQLEKVCSSNKCGNFSSSSKEQDSPCSEQAQESVRTTEDKTQEKLDVLNSHNVCESSISENYDVGCEEEQTSQNNSLTVSITEECKISSGALQKVGNGNQNNDSHLAEAASTAVTSEITSVSSNVQQISNITVSPVTNVMTILSKQNKVGTDQQAVDSSSTGHSIANEIPNSAEILSCRNCELQKPVVTPTSVNMPVVTSSNYQQPEVTTHANLSYQHTPIRVNSPRRQVYPRQWEHQSRPNSSFGLHHKPSIPILPKGRNQINYGPVNKSINLIHYLTNSTGGKHNISQPSLLQAAHIPSLQAPHIPSQQPTFSAIREQSTQTSAQKVAEKQLAALQLESLRQRSGKKQQEARLAINSLPQGLHHQISMKHQLLTSNEIQVAPSNNLSTKHTFHHHNPVDQLQKSTNVEPIVQLHHDEGKLNKHFVSQATLHANDSLPAHGLVSHGAQLQGQPYNKISQCQSLPQFLTPHTLHYLGNDRLVGLQQNTHQAIPMNSSTVFRGIPSSSIHPTIPFPSGINIQSATNNENVTTTMQAPSKSPKVDLQFRQNLSNNKIPVMVKRVPPGPGVAERLYALLPNNEVIPVERSVVQQELNNSMSSNCPTSTLERRNDLSRSDHHTKKIVTNSADQDTILETLRKLHYNFQQHQDTMTVKNLYLKKLETPEGKYLIDSVLCQLEKLAEEKGQSLESVENKQPAVGHDSSTSKLTIEHQKTNLNVSTMPHTYEQNMYGYAPNTGDYVLNSTQDKVQQESQRVEGNHVMNCTRHVTFDLPPNTDSLQRNIPPVKSPLFVRDEEQMDDDQNVETEYAVDLTSNVSYNDVSLEEQDDEQPLDLTVKGKQFMTQLEEKSNVTPLDLTWRHSQGKDTPSPLPSNMQINDHLVMDNTSLRTNNYVPCLASSLEHQSVIYPSTFPAGRNFMHPIQPINRNNRHKISRVASQVHACPVQIMSPTAAQYEATKSPNHNTYDLNNSQHDSNDHSVYIGRAELPHSLEEATRSALEHEIHGQVIVKTVNSNAPVFHQQVNVSEQTVPLQGNVCVSYQSNNSASGSNCILLNSNPHILLNTHTTSASCSSPASMSQALPQVSGLRNNTSQSVTSNSNVINQTGPIILRSESINVTNQNQCDEVASMEKEGSLNNQTISPRREEAAIAMGELAMGDETLSTGQTDLSRSQSKNSRALSSKDEQNTDNSVDGKSNPPTVEPTKSRPSSPSVINRCPKKRFKLAHEAYVSLHPDPVSPVQKECTTTNFQQKNDGMSKQQEETLQSPGVNRPCPVQPQHPSTLPLQEGIKYAVPAQRKRGRPKGSKTKTRLPDGQLQEKNTTPTIQESQVLLCQFCSFSSRSRQDIRIHVKQSHFAKHMKDPKTNQPTGAGPLSSDSLASEHNEEEQQQVNECNSMEIGGNTTDDELPPLSPSPLYQDVANTLQMLQKQPVIGISKLPPQELPVPSCVGETPPDLQPNHKEETTEVVGENNDNSSSGLGCDESMQKTLSEEKSTRKNRHEFYICKICRYSARAAHLLRRHMLKWHADREKYICTSKDCGMAFQTSEDLKQHAESHERRFSCYICGARYQHINGLRAHQERHSQDYPNTCEDP